MKPKFYVLYFIFSFILITGFALAQTPIKGIIKRTNGEPLPRATVKIRGTNIAVSADDNGIFTIQTSQEPPLYLQVSSVGYKPQDFQVLKLQADPLELVLVENALLDEIVVTSRRRSEVLQDVPIPISVVGGTQIEQSGAFNVNRVKELIPSVQLYTSNPRNTGINIRGIGSPFGLTNDGLDPGVGFYVDGDIMLVRQQQHLILLM
jgi:iron complex outermembrane receptor protein